MIRFSIIIFLTTLLIACNPPLEREGIPVIGGLSIDSARACNQVEVLENLEVFQELTLSSWMIEIPMVIRSYEDSEAFTYYEGHSLDSMVSLLQNAQVPYSLTFDLKNPFRVSGNQFRPDGYLTDMSGLLLRTAAYPPERIVFMGTLLDSAMMGDKFRHFIKELREDFAPFVGDIVLAARPEMLQSPAFDWGIPDVVGIIYDAPPDLDYKPHFRQINTALSALLLRHQKPALIVQSNLLGKNKLLLFQNQLRFWDKQVDLQGIVLNSIYCRFSLADTQTYYALGEDRPFREYLKGYTSVNEN